MRFIITAAVWIVILALMGFLFSIRDGGLSITHHEKVEKHVQVAFEITATFSVEDDPFALNVGEENAAFEISLDGKTVFSTTEGVQDRISFTTDSYEVAGGKHELFIKANPSDNSISQAVRIRVLSEGNPVNEATFWFTPGQTVNASHIFEIEIKGDHDEH